MGSHSSKCCQTDLSEFPLRLGRPKENGKSAGWHGELGTMKDAVRGARFHDRVTCAAEDAKTRLTTKDLHRHIR